MEGQKLEVLSIVVQNNYGVLARISSLFGRRGYNIDTLRFQIQMILIYQG